MKNKLTSLLILPAIFLSSCDFNLINVVTHEQNIGVYDLDHKELTDTNDDISNAYIQTVKARFIEEEPLIPYLSIEQYASFYESHFAKGAYNSISKSGNKIYWLIYSNQGLCFRTVIDTYEKTIVKVGDINYAFKDDDDPRDLKALNYGLDLKGSYVSKANLQEKYDYKSAHIKRFSVNGKNYFPLGFLDLTFSNSSGVYFTYNYSHIYETHDVENYTEKRFKDQGISYTFDRQMKEKSLAVIPTYLAKYNADLFIYLMDNFYGLKEYYGINNMHKHFDNLGYLDDLYSLQDKERNYAYSYLLNSFDDNHTALISQNGTWGVYSPARSGEGIIARHNLNVELNEIRNEYYASLGKTPNKDIIYSDDNLTAMFMFDHFYYGSSEEVFNEDGSIKESAKDYDHYFQLVSVLKEIRNNHPTTKNVILDIATNGGGVVGIMMKLLSLLSTDNSAHLYLYTDTSKEIIQYYAQVDSNFDGLYDDNDAYGKYFNFYILTSDCSFSCGNAFPSVAKKEGIAKIIGQTSGGGECAVAIHYLPNSEYVYHSSNLHLGYYDSDSEKFVGFESGATPDIEIKTVDSSFFDINKLNTLIK